jgi:hypothetical protein
MKRTALILVAGILTMPSAAQTLRDSYELGGDAVISIDAGTVPDPIPSSLPAAHRAVLARKAKSPAIKQWIVNIDLSGAIGVQFLLRGPGQHAAVYDDRWITQFAFNGASEKGTIEAGRWCRSGASKAYSAICKDIEAAVERRNVGRLIR